MSFVDLPWGGGIALSARVADAYDTTGPHGITRGRRDGEGGGYSASVIEWCR